MHGKRLIVLSSAILTALALGPAEASHASVVPSLAKASAGAAHAAATIDTSQAKPCNEVKKCRQGYDSGYAAGRRCQGNQRSQSFSKSDAQWERGYDKGFDRAERKFCDDD